MLINLDYALHSSDIVDKHFAAFHDLKARVSGKLLWILKSFQYRQTSSNLNSHFISV